MRNSAALITFSHLRWNFVYQRPQHLLSRLAKHRQVIFVEEPVFEPNTAAHWAETHPEENVTVLRPHTPVDAPGFCEAQLPFLAELVKDLIYTKHLENHVAWFYTPMALPLLSHLQPQAIVYDCMDELAGFKGAPPELMRNEDQLFQLADVVFTGGKSLYESKRPRHANIHCFPSSVDANHFMEGVKRDEAPDQASLPHPRIGYYGVIDERIDLSLLEALATARPEWQICMVGPVVKIDPGTLPQRPNLHYFGQRAYNELPTFLKGWDVCMLPFALNDATRFISPTKTLEYMAGRKLMVSTPIQDVREPYGDIAFIAHSHDEFIACCEEALNMVPVERQRRLDRGSQVLAETSWDRTAGMMNTLIEEAIHWPAQHRTRRHDAEVVVIGAGPTGLSAAYHLGKDAVLIEQNDRVGGWCRSIVDNGFTYDFAGHIMFSADPYVHQMYKMLLGDNVHWQDREAWVYSKNVYTRYPFQGSLYGLPADVIKECIVGAIESRYGAIKKKPETKANGTANSHANGHSTSKHANGHTNGTTTSKAQAAADLSKDGIADCCADGILEASAPLTRNACEVTSNAEPKNFEEFIYKVWGAGIAKHFAIPYNKKLWAVPLCEMETSWLGGRVPMPDLEDLIEGALKPSTKPMGPNARFGYPLRGGFQALMDGFLPRLAGKLLLNTKVATVSPSKRRIRLVDGTEYNYQQLISTMPLPALVRAMGTEAPGFVQEAARALRHVSVRCVNLGIGRENLTDKHWIYYPEDTVFHRIFVQGNASPFCNPPGGFGLTCEITYSEHKPLPCDGEDLIQRCIEDCHRVGMFTPQDPVWSAVQVDMPYAYVVYDHTRKQAVETIRDWLLSNGIILAGRYSEWEYYNSDHAFVAGKQAAEKARSLRQDQVQLVPESLLWSTSLTDRT